MRNTGSWIAFLVTLFLAVGLCGMFASYAVTIPLDRAAAREAMLDEVLTADDPATAVQRLRPRLGSLEAPLAAAGPWAQRVAAARAVVTGEARRESASIEYRVRLMLGVVTVIAAAMGAGLLMLAAKPVPQA